TAEQGRSARDGACGGRARAGPDEPQVVDTDVIGGVAGTLPRPEADHGGGRGARDGADYGAPPGGVGGFRSAQLGEVHPTIIGEVYLQVAVVVRGRREVDEVEAQFRVPCCGAHVHVQVQVPGIIVPRPRGMPARGVVPFGGNRVVGAGIGILPPRRVSLVVPPPTLVAGARGVAPTGGRPRTGVGTLVHPVLEALGVQYAVEHRVGDVREHFHHIGGVLVHGVRASGLQVVVHRHARHGGGGVVQRGGTAAAHGVGPSSDPVRALPPLVDYARAL